MTKGPAEMTMQELACAWANCQELLSKIQKTLINEETIQNELAAQLKSEAEAATTEEWSDRPFVFDVHPEFYVVLIWDDEDRSYRLRTAAKDKIQMPVDK